MTNSKSFLSFLLAVLHVLAWGEMHGAYASNLPTAFANGMIQMPSKVTSEAQVIEAAKNVMANSGYFNSIDTSLYADDFIFRGPVIGPLNKRDYKEVLDYFSIYKAFPDMDPNCFGFTVDPENPLRVWYFVRYVLYSGVVYVMHFIIQNLNHFLFLLELPEHTNNQLGDLWDQL